MAQVNRGKTAIEFSGTAAQLRAAFQTELHTYIVNGEVHHANDRDPQIPLALAPVVAGITPMNDFRPRSDTVTRGRATYNVLTHQATPEWTQTTSTLELAPDDFAVQYDVNPLYNAGVTGAGITIGVIGDSNIDPSLVAAYRSLFHLPANPINVILAGNDPGITGSYGEAYLDVEEAGAIAPGATVNFYTAQDTFVQQGTALAALREVDDDVASVLSASYGVCEQTLGAAGNQFWNAVWEQAAAQGQTTLVSTGDYGAAGCDDIQAEVGNQVEYGIAVNGIASTPWNIAVGGTDFYYSDYNGAFAALDAQIASYWNQTITTLPSTSLLAPIPEQPWNSSFGLNVIDRGNYNPSSPLVYAGAGGASGCTSGAGSSGAYTACTGGYAKPGWQTGAGVPADGARDLPDVSLFAAAGSNESAYPFCIETTDCIVSNNDTTVAETGGTSSSTPAMAGILALVNQKYGRQGQANTVLYALAAQHPSAFHDIAVGSNVMPCVPASPNCVLSTLNDNTNGFYTLGKYYATPGYDLATGLGSIDANLLLQFWSADLYPHHYHSHYRSGQLRTRNFGRRQRRRQRQWRHANRHRCPAHHRDAFHQRWGGRAHPAERPGLQQHHHLPRRPVPGLRALQRRQPIRTQHLRRGRAERLSRSQHHLHLRRVFRLQPILQPGPVSLCQRDADHQRHRHPLRRQRHPQCAARRRQRTARRH